MCFQLQIFSFHGLISSVRSKKKLKTILSLTFNLMGKQGMENCFQEMANSYDTGGRIELAKVIVKEVRREFLGSQSKSLIVGLESRHCIDWRLLTKGFTKEKCFIHFTQQKASELKNRHGVTSPSPYSRYSKNLWILFDVLHEGDKRIIVAFKKMTTSIIRKIIFT